MNKQPEGLPVKQPKPGDLRARVEAALFADDEQQAKPKLIRSFMDHIGVLRPDAVEGTPDRGPFDSDLAPPASRFIDRTPGLETAMKMVNPDVAHFPVGEEPKVTSQESTGREEATKD